MEEKLSPDRPTSIEGRRLAITETEIMVTNEQGERLFGRKTVFADSRKRPAVILCHSLGGNSRETGFDALTSRLYDKGIHVVRFDFPGHGKSGGKFSETTISKLTSSLLTMIEFAKRQPDIDENAIGLFAISMGTGIAMALFKSYPEEFASVKALAFCSSIPDFALLTKNLWTNIGKMARQSPLTSLKVAIASRSPVFQRITEEMKQYDLPQLIEALRTPILGIHGNHDAFFPSTMAEKYINSTLSPYEFISLPAGHSIFSDKKASKSALGHVAQWFTRWLE